MELHPVEFALDADPASPPVVGEPAVGPDGRRITGVTNINSVFSGDLSGTAFGAVFLAGNQAASGGGGVDIWTITDSPCGAGTLVVNFAIHGQETTRTVGVWRIAPGTGTGDLQAVRGGRNTDGGWNGSRRLDRPHPLRLAPRSRCARVQSYLGVRCDAAKFATPCAGLAAFRMRRAARPAA